MNMKERRHALDAINAVENVLASFEQMTYQSSYETQLAARLEKAQKSLKKLLGA